MGTSSTQHLFAYTSGRYLYNEPRRLAERYVEFDVVALRDLVTKTIGHGGVSTLVKLAEGGFNKILLLTMQDGHEVIVKIPFRISIPKHYATASEVATLKLLRSRGLPVPAVYAWSCDASKSPIGSEFILMEKAPGVGLDNTWFDLTTKQRYNLLRTYSELEVKLFDIPFGSIGSVYFKEDVPSHLQKDLYLPDTIDEAGDSQRYCMGPIVDTLFWNGRRAEMDLDRGPWQKPAQYLQALGAKEVQWTRLFGKPALPRFPHRTVIDHPVSPAGHLEVLDKYLSAAPHLLPSDISHPMNRPTLRHPDPSPQNIFVDPETHEISCIIDWQHAMVLPLLLAAGYPPMFENPDPIPPRGLEKPQRPADYDSLSPEDKVRADDLHRRRWLHFGYRAFNGAKNKPHLAALGEPLRWLRQWLVDRAARQWNGDVFTLRGALTRMSEHWSELHHLLPAHEQVACPYTFTAEELAYHNEHEDDWISANDLVEVVREKLGVGENGWVGSDRYAFAVKENQEIKVQCQEHLPTDERKLVDDAWPFDDHEEIE
ncbi:MAG: Phosphotransferase enzyme [Caeruleum heppii]|nr:MAG: Phosphotransferase enzyme [Caeruleum heppii]